MSEDRIEALDVLRGVAVIGILFGNVIGFGLPIAASLHPFLPGEDTVPNLAAWATSLLLIDGKMRALFAMLFGASMLLMLERAAMDGRDGGRAHRARMVLLLPIGVLHYLLLYQGDILMLLAIAGLIALPLARLEPLALLKWAAGFIALQLTLSGAFVAYPFVLRGDGLTDAQALSAWQGYAAALGLDGSGSLPLGVADRLTAFPTTLIDLLLFALAETLGFMALGMAMLKGGFLAAQWPAEQFRQTARHGLRIGLVGMALLAAWVLWSGDPLVAQAVTLAASLPLRVPIAVAYAALAMALVANDGMPAVRSRFASVGRMALSNYLLSSLLLATLFAPWGIGWFDALSRPALWLVAIGVGLILLLWSPLWLRWQRQGPVEAVWRKATRLIG